VAGAGDLDWNDLRHFLAAVRAGTLAGAARALGVKHSTVGRRLTALERSLGGALFVRGPDGLHLTPLGEKLVPLAEEMERSANAFRVQASTQTAHVRLALLTGFVGLFTPHMEWLTRNHPGISLEFLSSNRRVDLNKDEAELALRAGSLGEDNLVARKVSEIGWSLYASPEYLRSNPAPQDPRDLAGHKLVGFGENLTAVPGAKWIAAHGKGATIAIQLQDAADFVAATAAGVGLAILPCVLAGTDPRLKRLTPEVLGRMPLSLVYRRDALLAKPVQVVVRFVLHVVREEAKTIRGELV
jgi:DNA-binding transcriptional LysR family regulator